MELTAEQLSKATRVPLKSIFFYVERGLLKPKRVNAVTCESFYNIEAVYTLRKIKMLRDIDLNFDEIHRVLYGDGGHALIEEKKVMLYDRIAATENLISELDNIFDSSRFLKDYKPEIKNIPDYCVCYSKGIIRDRSEISDYIQSVLKETRDANPDLEFVKPKYEFLSYDDDAYINRELRVNCVRAVTSAGIPTKNVKFNTLKGCEIVTVKHTGSYYLLSDATIAALNWISDEGYKQAGNIRFMGITEPWESCSEQDHVTEVQIPVVLKSRK